MRGAISRQHSAPVPDPNGDGASPQVGGARVLFCWGDVLFCQGGLAKIICRTSISRDKKPASRGGEVAFPWQVKSFAESPWHESMPRCVEAVVPCLERTRMWLPNTFRRSRGGRRRCRAQHRWPTNLCKSGYHLSDYYRK